MKLDDEFTEAISSAFYNCWQAIAPDCEGFTDEECVECVIDANRMTIYGGEQGTEADALVEQAVIEHGYEEVLNFLSKKFQL